MSEGFSTITTRIIVKDAEKSVDLYKKALGAEVLKQLECPKTGKIVHACLQVGDSKLFMCAENEDMGCMAPAGDVDSVTFYMYVDDADKAFDQAVKAGLSEVKAVEDTFWGDRMGSVRDHNGYHWQLATQVREVSQEEMQEAMKAMAEGECGGEGASCSTTAKSCSA